MVAGSNVGASPSIAAGVGLRNLLRTVGFESCQRYELGNYYYDFRRLFGCIQHHWFLYFYCSSVRFDKCGRFRGGQR